MTQTRLKETVTSLRLIPPEPAESRLGRNRARCAIIHPPNAADLIPYSAKDLKYLWTLWDEAQRRHQPGWRYRHISVGAVGVSLTGWLIHGMGLSGPTPFGGILMLAGALVGAWYCLKSLRPKALRPVGVRVWPSP
jgi:hypothetical protein